MVEWMVVYLVDKKVGLMAGMKVDYLAEKMVG